MNSTMRSACPHFYYKRSGATFKKDVFIGTAGYFCLAKVTLILPLNCPLPVIIMLIPVLFSFFQIYFYFLYAKLFMRPLTRINPVS